MYEQYVSKKNIDFKIYKDMQLHQRNLRYDFLLLEAGRTLYANKPSLRFMETCWSQNQTYGISNGQEKVDTTSKSRIVDIYTVYIYTFYIMWYNIIILRISFIYHMCILLDGKILYKPTKELNI